MNGIFLKKVKIEVNLAMKIDYNMNSFNQFLLKMLLNQKSYSLLNLLQKFHQNFSIKQPKVVIAKLC